MNKPQFCPHCSRQVLDRLEHYDGFGNGVACEWSTPTETCKNCGLKTYNINEHFHIPMFYNGKLNYNHFGGKYKCTKRGVLRNE